MVKSNQIETKENTSYNTKGIRKTHRIERPELNYHVYE